MMHIGILSRFLFKRFFRGVGLVLLIVSGIIYAVTFVERLTGNPTIIATLNDAWVRLMEYVPMFLPLSVFMGTLVAYYGLTRSSEGIIIAGSGLSPYQIARPFFVGAFLIGAFAATVINPYAVKISSENITSEKLQLVDNAIWLREASDNGYITITAKDMRKSGEDLVFLNTTIYVQNAEFKLQNRINAARVQLSGDGLVTNDAEIFDSNGKVYHDKWNIKTLITPKTVLERYLQPDQISFWNLPGFIKKMSGIGVSVRGHLVQFWTLLFLPLTMIAMTTLGVAFSQTRQRRNHNFGTKFSIGILTCFVLYFLLNIFNALGASGALPALLAIIAPPLIIIALSGIFIAEYDTI